LLLWLPFFLAFSFVFGALFYYKYIKNRMKTIFGFKKKRKFYDLIYFTFFL
jgi:hypothetical protein